MSLLSVQLTVLRVKTMLIQEKNLFQVLNLSENTDIHGVEIKPRQK